MREVFVFGAEPGAPGKKPRLDTSDAERVHETLNQMLYALLDVEEQIGVDLNVLYKMRTDGTPARDEALTSWPSTLLSALKSEFSIEKQDEEEIVTRFSIEKKDDAFVFSHMGGFFNFRNVGGEFSSGDEPRWLQLPSLPKTIMEAAIAHFGVMEIIDCAYPSKQQIAGKYELEKLPIRLHKFLTSNEDFKKCSYYAKFGFAHVVESENAWRIMNEMMRRTFTDDMRTQYQNVSVERHSTADENYTFQDLAVARRNLNFQLD